MRKGFQYITCVNGNKEWANIRSSRTRRSFKVKQEIWELHRTYRLLTKWRHSRPFAISYNVGIQEFQPKSNRVIDNENKTKDRAFRKKYFKLLMSAIIAVYGFQTTTPYSKTGRTIEQNNILNKNTDLKRLETVVFCLCLTRGQHRNTDVFNFHGVPIVLVKR